MELARRADFSATYPAEKNLARFFDKAKTGLGGSVPEGTPNQSALRFRQLYETHFISISDRLMVQACEPNNAQTIATSDVGNGQDPAPLTPQAPITLNAVENLPNCIAGNFLPKSETSDEDTLRSQKALAV